MERGEKGKEKRLQSERQWWDQYTEVGWWKRRGWGEGPAPCPSLRCLQGGGPGVHLACGVPTPQHCQGRTCPGGGGELRAGCAPMIPPGSPSFRFGLLPTAGGFSGLAILPSNQTDRAAAFEDQTSPHSKGDGCLFLCEASSGFPSPSSHLHASCFHSSASPTGSWAAWGQELYLTHCCICSSPHPRTPVPWTW